MPLKKRTWTVTCGVVAGIAFILACVGIKDVRPDLAARPEGPPYGALLLQSLALFAVLWLIGVLVRVSWAAIRRVKVVLSGKDPGYDVVSATELAAYQIYFRKALDVIDLDTQTKWGMSMAYDKDRFEQDEAAMKTVFTDAQSVGLKPSALQVMLTQYFLADPRQRVLDTNCWVQRVFYRKGADYFPSASAVVGLLDNA
jgi:hypothetical protein